MTKQLFPVRCAVFAVLLIFGLAASAAPPQRVVLHYQMSHNGTLIAEVTETLEHDGKTYRIVSEGRGAGLLAFISRTLRRSSEGRIGSRGLMPVEFRDQRGDDLAVAKFDWTKKLLTEDHRGETQTKPLSPGTQDRLSYMWNMAFAMPADGRIDATVADGRGTAQFRFAPSGVETLKTSAGEIEALHLVKQKDPGDERDTDIWIAIKRSNIPVRVLVVEKDGTRMDQVVARIED